MILDQLKMGEHQAKWRALVSRNEETERMFNPCSSHSWKNAQTPSVMFFRLDVLIFCQGIRKYCFFSFFSENLDKWWMNGHPVILRGCQICVLIAFHAIFRPTLDYRCCAISSRELSVCAIFYALKSSIITLYNFTNDGTSQYGGLDFHQQRLIQPTPLPSSFRDKET